MLPVISPVLLFTLFSFPSLHPPGRFIFGATADEVPSLRMKLRYTSDSSAIKADPKFVAVLEDLRAGKFGGADLVNPLLGGLEAAHDYYLVGYDFNSCTWLCEGCCPAPCAVLCRSLTHNRALDCVCADCEAQKAVDAAFLDQKTWTIKSILSTAGMGKFSTDRT